MRNIEIPEMTLVLAEDDTIIGDMHVLFVNEKGCMFVPDENLQKMLSDEEMEELRKNILEKLEMKWTSNKIELGN